MFEFDKYDSKRHSDTIIHPAGLIESLPVIEKISFLMWGEHCVECAAPDCFSTCDLYDARQDKRCRRFVFGIFKNRNFSTFRGTAAELVFKKWGKLETRGNTYMLPLRKALALELLISFLSPFVNLLGSLLGKVTNEIRWNYLSYSLVERFVYRLQKRSKNNKSPEAFLIEIYNPTDQDASIKLSLSINRSRLPKNLTITQLPQPFASKFCIKPGFFREIIPIENISSITESGLAFDMNIIPDGEKNLHLVILALDFVTFSNDVGKANKVSTHINDDKIANKPDVKCVVFDLDNTLWHGTLLENENVELRQGIKELIQLLDKRGILISIASKNAHDQAWSKLQTFGLEKYFLYPKINWMPKSQNIKQLAKNLNIGLDTFLFVDDNPFELQEVGLAIPEISCLHVDQIANLLDYPRLKGSSSEEAQNRRVLYQEAILREQAETTFGNDYIAFLKSCNIIVNISMFSEEDLERIVELVQRTNQLNFSGNKYDRSQILSILSKDNLENWVIKCQDKFGSYGTVGFCIASRQDNVLKIEDLMLSCRVQGKFIEQALFAYLLETHPKPGAKMMKVNFKSTARNEPAIQILNQLGFVLDDTSLMSMTVSPESFLCDFISINPFV